MNRYFSLFVLLIGASAAICAQDKPPVPLFEAAHCLVTENHDHNWVDLQNVKELHLGYHADEKTILGDKYAYVVVYTNPKRTEGTIFDVRVKKQHVYNIENNATFVSTPKGVTFPLPPEGGVWAQNQLVTAIQQMEHHRKWYVASVKSLAKESKHVGCESSVDKQ